jgi:hypothetical protein
MAFEKGHEKLGGRKSHTPNKVTQSIRGLLNAELPEDELRKLWHKYLYNKDPAIAFEAFKLANQYMFGKPALSPISLDDSPQIGGVPEFALNQIVTRHVPYVPVT